MSTATLTIDLDAISANWRALDAMSSVETAAVIKADSYGLGADRVGRALVRAGARTLCVAVAEEGVALRRALGPGPAIHIFSGHMAGDSDMIRDMDLIPMINSLDQMVRHVESLPGHSFGVQLDTGMNRLGMSRAEWAALRDITLSQSPALIMSHLACADEPGSLTNEKQLQLFQDMTAGVNAPRSLANTAGVLLGPDYHFDLTRPGIGLFGAAPFSEGQNAITLDIPVIQCRNLNAGEMVGYGNSYATLEPMRLAIISAGYADGIPRCTDTNIHIFNGETPCPIVGRISMDLIAVDISDVSRDPKSLQLLNSSQGVDTLAKSACTIGHEILTSLGRRYARRYTGA